MCKFSLCTLIEESKNWITAIETRNVLRSDRVFELLFPNNKTRYQATTKKVSNDFERSPKLLPVQKTKLSVAKNNGYTNIQALSSLLHFAQFISIW